MSRLQKFSIGLGLLIAATGLITSFSTRALADATYVPRTQKQIANATYKFGSSISTIIVTFPADKVGSQSVDGGQITFTDGDTFDSNPNYRAPGGSDGFCSEGQGGGSGGITLKTGTGSNLDIGSVANFGNTVKAQVDLDYLPLSATGHDLSKCQNTSPNSYTRNVSNAKILNSRLTWKSDGTLEALGPVDPEGFIGGSPDITEITNLGMSPITVFAATGFDNVMRNGDSDCPSVAIIANDNKSASIYVLSKASGSINSDDVPVLKKLSLGCSVVSVNNIKSPNLDQATAASDGGGYQILGDRSGGGTSTGAGSGSASDSNSNTDDNAKCVASGGGAYLEWALCPIITGVSKFVDGAVGVVQDQLDFSLNRFLPDTTDPTHNQVKTAWIDIKNVVSALVVVIMLIMVISQAVGSGAFEAYTVKKMLPKLVVAVILMQISWYLCRYFIVLANDAGKGIADILTYPFGGTGNLDLPSLLHHANPVWAAGISAFSLTAVFIALIGFHEFIVPIICLVGFSALMGILVGLATLLFRNILIIMLVLFSPLAFLAWAFPNPGVQKYWKMWSDNFTKLLVLFPLMMGMIYSGRIAAWAAGGLGGTTGILDISMVLIGFFGPLFMLPKAFKWGGSALSAASNGISQNKLLNKGKEFGTGQMKEWIGRRSGAASEKYDDRDKSFRAGLGRLKGEHLPSFLKTNERTPMRDENGEIMKDRLGNKIYEPMRDKDGHVMMDKDGNPIDETRRVGRRIVPQLGGRAITRIKSGSMMPTNYGRAKTIEKGRKYGETEKALAMGLVMQRAKMAEKDGGITTYDMEEIKDAHGQVIGEKAKRKDIPKGRRGGTAALKASFVNSMGDKDPRVRAAAVEAFLRSSSFPEMKTKLVQVDTGDAELMGKIRANGAELFHDDDGGTFVRPHEHPSFPETVDTTEGLYPIIQGKFLYGSPHISEGKKPTPGVAANDAGDPVHGVPPDPEYLVPQGRRMVDTIEGYLDSGTVVGQSETHATEMARLARKQVQDLGMDIEAKGSVARALRDSLQGYAEGGIDGERALGTLYSGKTTREEYDKTLALFGSNPDGTPKYNLEYFTQLAQSRRATGGGGASTTPPPTTPPAGPSTRPYRPTSGGALEAGVNPEAHYQQQPSFSGESAYRGPEGQQEFHSSPIGAIQEGELMVHQPQNYESATAPPLESSPPTPLPPVKIVSAPQGQSINSVVPTPTIARAPGDLSTGNIPQTAIPSQPRERSAEEVIREQQREETEREMAYQFRRQREKDRRKIAGFNPESNTGTGELDIDHGPIPPTPGTEIKPNEPPS
jgi:hypothetical protein